MPVTTKDLQQILSANPQAHAAYTTGLHSGEVMVPVINLNHAHAGSHVAGSFHGLPLSVRYANRFAARPPRDPEATVDLDEPDVPPGDAN